MELLVLRHGKSSWADPALADYDRPLKKRGKRDASRMGIYLRERQLFPELVLSSTAERANQTARRTLRAMGLSASLITWSRSFYHAEPEVWLGALAKIPENIQRVLIVGHNPGLEALIDLLCGTPPRREDDGKLLPTAALAHLHLSLPWADIAPGTGKLNEIQRPRYLSEQADLH